ncbi:MAG TPA: hypothetical protein DD473_02570 [Planctomycetaceae bacterium]|nr:hypothetical protein [Planctomycetaceae bacterium]
MHITGKIFAFLTLCLAVAAIILTAKTLDKQNEWNRRVEKARDDYEASLAKLPDVENKANQLEEEITLSRLGWGRHWNDVEVTASPNIARGLINIGIGRNEGLVQTTATGDQYPQMYAFQENADGTMSYVGEFRVTQVDVNRAALQLSRTPREGEVNNWNFNNKWRFRDALPPAKRKSVSELLLKMTTVEQRLSDRRQFLSIQQDSLAAAKTALQNRMNELNGDPQAPEGAGDEYSKGLVATMNAAEEKRNAALAEVQKLRGELANLHARFEKLLSENSEMENKLSSQSKTASSATEPPGN